ncbi:MAG: PAS domain-containing sensor histidine kinase [Candidatus Cloacimonetes bacterium]|nr:PAS domain-containing sensor histidine kinase [Candidatus Cloacimonadota bacterium]
MSDNVKKPSLGTPETNAESMLPELVANLMGNLPGMAYRCMNDENWTMIFLSEGCHIITGYTGAEILNNSASIYNELIHKDDRAYVRQCVNEAVAKRSKFQMEYRIVDKAGDIRWVWEQGNAIYNMDNAVMFIDGYITEISSRKKTENEIKQVAQSMVEMNATKDKFFSLIAHDLQNPVYAIISLTEFLNANLHNLSSADLTSFAAQINVSAKGIYALLENLLDWTKSQTSEMQVQKEYLSLTKLIDFLVQQFLTAAEDKGIKVDFQYTEEFVVESDSHMLTSILRNLISNALKYSYPNSEVKIRLSQTNNMTSIEVEDKGVGISRRNIAKIFRIDSDLRYPGTNKEPGSGLGLILAKEFADKLGIQLSVDSKLNKGSTFTLKIAE